MCVAHHQVMTDDRCGAPETTQKLISKSLKGWLEHSMGRPYTQRRWNNYEQLGSIIFETSWKIHTQLVFPQVSPLLHQQKLCNLKSTCFILALLRALQGIELCDHFQSAGEEIRSDGAPGASWSSGRVVQLRKSQVLVASHQAYLFSPTKATHKTS